MPSEGPPDALTFQDAGSVVYTNPIDPAQDPTRDHVVVDPASGSLTFRLPLPHTIKGRAADINPELIYRSSFHNPGSKLGPDHWVFNFWKLLTVEAILHGDECEQGEFQTSLLDIISNSEQIVQHDGERGTVVWTNHDAATGARGFGGEGTARGMPPSNLSPLKKLHVPDSYDPAMGTVEYDVVDNADACLYGTVMAPDLNPKQFADFGADDRTSFPEFVPPLGTFAAMKVTCADVRIRYPNGVVDVFTRFVKKQEDWIEWIPPTGGTQGGPGPDSIRVQFLAVPVRTEYPNGDTIEYLYDQEGRLSSIVDNYGRVALKLAYEGVTNRVTSLVEPISGNSTLFGYNSLSKVLETVTTAHTGDVQQWRFDTVSQILENPDEEKLRPEIARIRIPLGFKVFRPGDPVDVPFLNAKFEFIVDPDNDDYYSPWNGRITDVFFAGYNESDPMNPAPTEDINIGGTNYSFTSGEHVSYSYAPFGGCTTGGLPISVTVYSQNMGLTRTHLFDEMSREIYRIDDVTVDEGPPAVQEHLKTQFYYGYNEPGQGAAPDSPWPMVTKTVDPKGNTTETLYQAFVDDGLGKSYFSVDEGQDLPVRDPFSGGNIVKTTRKAAVGQDPDIVETWKHEPFTNQVRVHVDPLNHVTEHFFDYQEDPVGEGVPGALDFWRIDYSEIEAEAWNIGDGGGNSDGKSQFMGNRIRTDYESVTEGFEIAGSQDAAETTSYNLLGQPLWDKDAEQNTTEYEYYEVGIDTPHVGTIGSTSTHTGYLARTSVDTGSEWLETEYGYKAIGLLTWEKNPRGYYTWRAYDEVNRVTIERSGDIDDQGVPGGVYTEAQYEYDLNNRTIAIRSLNDDPETSTGGQLAGFVTTQFAYDLFDNLRIRALELIEPGAVGGQSRMVLYFFHHDADGNVVKEVAPVDDGPTPKGRAISYTYDEKGRVRSKTRHAVFDTSPEDPAPPNSSDDDAHLDFAYDLNSNMESATVKRSMAGGLPDTSGTITMTYDGFDRPIEQHVTWASGRFNKTIHVYDAASNIVEIRKEGPRDDGDTDEAVLAKQAYYYDERDRVYQIETDYFHWKNDGGGGYTLEDLGTGGGGKSVADLSYDKRNLIVAKRDDLGRVTRSEFDGAGRETKRTLPLVAGFTDANRKEFEYDANGNLRFERTFEYSKDDSGSEVLEGGGAYVSEKRYDPLDRVTKEFREPGTSDELRSDYSYNSLGFMTRELDPGTSERVGTLHRVDSLGRTTVKEYGHSSSFDPLLGLAVGPDNADGLVTATFEYDDAGNILVQKDDKGNPVSTEFDPIGRVEKVTYADLSTETIEYSRQGTVLSESKSGPASELLYKVDYLYDLADRKTTATFDLSSTHITLSGVSEETFGYDGLGRVTAATATSLDHWDPTIEWHSTVEKQYDSMDFVREDRQRLDKRAAGGGAVLATLEDTTECSFDSLGRRESVSAAGGSYSRTYGFDVLDRIVSINDGGATDIHAFEYLGSGHRLREQANRNGTTVKSGVDGYDRLLRLTEMKHLSSTGTIQTGFDYEYDDAGNVVKELKTHAPFNPPSGPKESKSRKLDYDGVNRLIDFSIGEAGAWVSKEAYGLDGVGNWIDHDIVGPDPDLNTVNAMNEYVGDFDDVSVTYDLRGNLRQYGSDQFTYDARGRVVAAQIGTDEYSYVFDAEGRRVYAEGWFFTHEGKREIRQEDFDDPTVSIDFTFGTGIDEVLSFTSNDGALSMTYTLQRNRIGSTMGLSDESGALVERYDYTAFGEVLKLDVDGGGLVDSPLLFAGRREDKGTGLYFMRARYYLASMGRFLSRDPIGLWGDANNWGNAYAYVANNPYGGGDPFGLEGLTTSELDAINARPQCVSCTSGWIDPVTPRGLGDFLDFAGETVSDAGRVLQVVGGAAEVAVGVAATLGSGGAGAALGVVAIASGIDNIQAGIRGETTVIAGGVSEGLQRIGVPEGPANLAGELASLGLSTGASLGSSASTLGRSGRAPEFSRGQLAEGEVPGAAQRWLGDSYSEASPGRFLSEDGQRQFRYGLHETRDPSNHHAHFEALLEGRVVENARVDIVPDGKR